VKWILGFLCLWCAISDAKIYITITGAKVKKAKLAIGKLHALPDFKPKSNQLALSVHKEIFSDLEFTNVFEFVKPDAFTAFDEAKDLYSIKYEEWALVDTAFVLKLGYKLVGTNFILEAMLYDIAGEKKSVQHSLSL